MDEGESWSGFSVIVGTKSLIVSPHAAFNPLSARNTCARKSKTKVEQEHNKEFKYFAICLASSCFSIVPCAASASDSVSVSFAICISLSTRSFFWVHDKLMRNISLAFFFSLLCAPVNNRFWLHVDAIFHSCAIVGLIDWVVKDSFTFFAIAEFITT